ncbi:MAG TPA: hypothetical protein VFC15_18960 [Candidatus Limnocylindrales bacterium]|nr:hypothetical protein [Candidatus Limnocylindrales bacterium]
MTVRLIGVTLVIESLCILGFSQITTHPAHRSSANPAAQSKASGTKSQYLEVSFDPSATHLTPQFKGHDIVAISDSVRQAPALAPKSEFETTAAYEARRASFPTQRLIGDINSDSHLAFVVDEGLLNSTSEVFRYEADSGALTATLRGRSQKFFLERNQPDMQTVTIR